MDDNEAIYSDNTLRDAFLQTARNVQSRCQDCGYPVEQPHNDPPLPCRHCVDEARADEEP